MQIIGFNLNKIFIEKKDKQKEKINIKQNINIENISKDRITISNEEVLKINFSFVINYDPDFAKLEFQGVLLIIPKKGESKNIIESWENKKLSNEFKIPLLNFIMNKCNIKALFLEDELNLPIHLQNNLPKIAPN